METSEKQSYFTGVLRHAGGGLKHQQMTRLLCAAQISNAYEVLSDDQKRSIYDRYGEAGLKNGMGGMGGADMGGFNNPFDLFEQFFGASGGRAGAGGFGGFGTSLNSGNQIPLL